jgi:hypothetical protein
MVLGLENLNPNLLYNLQNLVLFMKERIKREIDALNMNKKSKRM